ncbi:hypothetical protein BDA99DRAFT_510316 [Phascolomyces articulosus]|uniref:F-box domain-containing protein n=1 Tax=Phascolomyces articulosus TaxID=60185 RepID=A0AAD5K9I2_9FUNG|nr:hypothetical protein BDA99DRAFT_510316 [Phascolomyces articulosus]
MSKRKHSTTKLLAPVKRRTTTNGTSDGLTKSHSDTLWYYADNPWQDLYDMYDQAISEKDYQDVAGSVTTAIDQLTDHFVKLLDLRARCRGNARDFNQGLDDGFKMIHESPTRAMGYIRAGHIYGLQGNLVKALEVLLQGVSCVPVYDPHYATLKRDAQEAEDRMSQHIDTLGLEAQFHQALNIAWDLINVHRRSPTGYLCAGHLHIMQGRVQAAMEMFQTGLQQVPLLDPRYHELADQLKLARQKCSQRFDILTSLPFDLMSHIFGHLSMPELTICMDISRGWRERVLQCTEAWRRLEVNSKYEMTLVKMVSKHIRHLKIDAGGESTDTCLKLISNREIADLETLEIDTVFRQAPTIRRFFSAFREIGPTLRKLNLKFARANPRPPPLVPIISMCPLLTHLTYHTWNLRRQDVKGARTRQKFVLTHLDLFTDRSIESPELEAILQHCPRMLCLVLYKCSPACLQLIPQYCRSIEYFSLNKNNILKSNGHWEQIPDVHHPGNNLQRRLSYPLQQQEQQVQRKHGLRALSIYTSDIIGPQGVVQFINSNKETVEELTLGIGDGDRSFTTLIQPWASLVLFEWNYQLRKIEFSLERCSTAILCAMIARCPNLEAIKLDRTGSLTDEVFHTLIDLAKLHQLELAGGTNTRITDEGLSWFFDHIADVESNRLRIVCFSDLSPVKENTLLSLAKVKSLQKLTIRRCQGVTERAMDQFADTLAKSTTISLQEVTFHAMATVTNSALARFGEIKSLVDMTLIRCSRIDDDGIQELLERWKTFKRLYIHGCFRVRQTTMFYCHGRMPHFFKSTEQVANSSS